MSSVDLHTQYSYQAMIPEAFAIVLAPTDTSRSCGLFRLTEPDGMNILKNCPETGFHPHKEPDNGSPVYEHCSNVYKNSNLRNTIIYEDTQPIRHSIIPASNVTSSVCRPPLLVLLYLIEKFTGIKFGFYENIGWSNVLHAEMAFERSQVVFAS
ncbi:STAM-binding protein [Trifolium pratense]|nr:STAM-binding protein [Trifolium pratense]